MSWTSRDEQEILKEWAVELSTSEITSSIFSQIDVNTDSYWIKSDGGFNLMEYDFTSTKEIREMIDKIFNEEYFGVILMPIIAGIMKGKQKIKSSCEANDKLDDKFSIPEYVYVF